MVFRPPYPVHGLDVVDGPLGELVVGLVQPVGLPLPLGGGGVLGDYIV